MPAKDTPDLDDREQAPTYAIPPKDNSPKRANGGSSKSFESDLPAGKETAVFGANVEPGIKELINEFEQDDCLMRQINDIRPAAADLAHEGSDEQLISELLAAGVLMPASS